MTMRAHEHFEILISASLAGDLTDAERAELDTHLDRCAQCRETLAAFAEQRRIVAGLRHFAPPRDLGARVRAGIESGAHASVPWWRRPAVMFAGVGGGLAAVAGALLALAVFNAPPDDPQVGAPSEQPVPSATLASATVVPTPQQEPTPTAVPVPSATPAATPTPAPQLAAEPDVYLAYTGPADNLALTLRDGRTGDTITELETPGGPPIAAEMSPDGQFLAYITRMGESGLNEVWVTRIANREAEGQPGALSPLAIGETVSLGDSVAGSEFLEVLSWSPNSYYLAYTLAPPGGGGPDAWVFASATAESQVINPTGTGYAAGWLPGMPTSATESSGLWVSRAGQRPSSELYSLFFPDASDCCTGHAIQDFFLPTFSPDRGHAIYWTGAMQRSGDEWLFVEGGAPQLTDVTFDGTFFEFTNERPLFSDVTIDRDAFASAAITWGADGDAYAVWDAQWTGTPQGSGGEYPNVNRVYFGHASDPRNLTEFHAIDEADIPQDASVVDVSVTTGRHLLVTVQEPIGGILDAPRGRLILVTRNTGNVPDEVRFLPDAEAEGWFGPAAHDAFAEAVEE